MEELISKAKAGDKDSFEKLIMSVQNDLYRISKTRLKNEDDVNDAIQNTVIKTYKYIKKLHNPQYFKTWIIRILFNECNNIIKQNSRYRKIEEKYEAEKSFESNSDYSLEELIENLNETEQIILNLYYREGYSYKEIGYILKTNLNTIKSKMLRAKEKLKKQYYNERSEK